VAAAVLSFACVVLAALALKTKMLPAPSERDWFKEELWTDPVLMRRYHIVSILSAHQAHIINVGRKANYLAWIELFLPASALAIFSVLLFS
jgi:hypothetical protein